MEVCNKKKYVIAWEEIVLFKYLFSPQAYLREGVALQNLGQHGEALAAFGAGLAQDANNTNLITGLIDAALKSPLKGIDTTF